MDVRRFDFPFGIEEEFFLVRSRTRRLAARIPAGLLAQAGRRLGACVRSELLQSQIETASPILHDVDEARDRVVGLRRGLAEIAAEHGLRLLAAGTCPQGAWSAQHGTEQPRYRRMLDDFQIVARRSLVCGLHIHVAIPSGIDRVGLMNRVTPWLPLFLALSTSSPFWNRQLTGLLSYRQSVYDEWPRSGIPDFFADSDDYARFAALLQRAGAIADAGQLWWNIRPSLTFPTLELRIADCCTHVEDALALAALYRCLVRLLLREPDPGGGQDATARRLVDENRWRAKRSGLAARFIRADGREPAPVAALLADLRERCREDAEALGCVDALTGLDYILARGTSADSQLAVYRSARHEGARHAPALAAVTDWLLQATIPDAGAGPS